MKRNEATEHDRHRRPTTIQVLGIGLGFARLAMLWVWRWLDD